MGVLVDDVVDRGLEVDKGLKTPRLSLPRKAAVRYNPEGEITLSGLD